MKRSPEPSIVSHRAVPRTPLCAGAAVMFLLAATAAVPGCGTPLSVAGLVVGTGSIVGGAVTYEKCEPDNKDGPVGALCGLGNAMSVLLVTIGSIMVAGSGVSLLVEHQ